MLWEHQIITTSIVSINHERYQVRSKWIQKSFVSTINKNHATCFWIKGLDDRFHYKSVTGKLNYLAGLIRLDIQYDIQTSARFSTKPTQDYLEESNILQDTQREHRTLALFNIPIKVIYFKYMLMLFIQKIGYWLCITWPDYCQVIIRMDNYIHQSYNYLGYQTANTDSP